MREILLINPSRSGKKRKGASTMPARRRRRAAPKRIAIRRNPSGTVKKYTRRASAGIRGAFGGISFKKALADVPATQLGMFAAKWAAKRFGGEAGALESDHGSWSATSYIKGAIGSVVAAMLANSFKPGTGQKVLAGGLNLMIYKAAQNEFIQGSDWAANQFGEGDGYVPDEYQGMLLAGQYGEETPFMLAEDGEFYPADDEYRMQGVLEPVGPMGSELEPVGPLGVDPYSEAYFR
jgi:hypothetical protein